MGLLTRRRKPAGPVVTADGPVPVTNAAPPAGPDPAAPVTERAVIRAADLDDAPGWTTLPPLAPLLPAMPYVFSHHFEDDLVAWQAPELALAPLGHAISTTAPAGVVEAIAVLSPESLGETPAGAAIADPALPLVMPVDGPPDAGPPELAPYRSARSVAPTSSAPPRTSTRPPSSTPAQPLPPRPTSAPRSAPPAGPAAGGTPAAPGPTMDPPAASSTPAASAPAPPAAPPLAPEGGETGLVGDAPLAPPLAGGLAPVTPTEAPNLLLQAPLPPQMPLVQLPATRLTPAEAARLGPRFDSPPAAAPGAAAASPPAAPPGAPAAASPPAPRAPGAPVDLPAAATPPDATGPVVAPPPDAPSPPAAGLIGERGLVPPADPIDRAVDDDGPVDRAELEAPLPLVDRPGPQDPRVGAEPSPPGLPAASVSPGAPAEPVTPASPEAQEHPTPTAPLVGDAPPLATGPTDGPEPVETAETTPETLPVARRGDADASPSPAPRRTGLGQPMTGLPPTAARFDPAALAKRMSMGDMIRARTDRKASPGLPLSERRDPGRVPGQGAPGTPPQGTALPLAPGSPIPRLGTGVGPTAAGTVSDSGYPAPRALPLVPIERIGPTIAGTAPEAVPPAGAVGPLASLRQSLLEPIPPSPPAPPPPSPPTEGAAVRAAVGQRHGVDLSQVPVDRSAAGAARARSLGARGFTSPSEVVIPPEAGTLNAGPGQALLAHELTHVAQRARRGPNLPAEHTPEGQVLEAEARSAELALAPSAPVRAAAAEGPPRHAASSAGPGQPSATLPLAATPGSRSGDGVSEAALMAAVQKLSQMGTPAPPGGGPTTVVMPAASVAAPAPAAAVQRASVAELAGRFGGQAAQAPPAAGAASSVFSTKPSDADLSKLVRWLYPLISFRIRGELRENRERAGLLTDSYRRW